MVTNVSLYSVHFMLRNDQGVKEETTNDYSTIVSLKTENGSDILARLFDSRPSGSEFEHLLGTLCCNLHSFFLHSGV